MKHGWRSSQQMNSIFSKNLESLLSTVSTSIARPHQHDHRGASCTLTACRDSISPSLPSSPAISACSVVAEMYAMHSDESVCYDDLPPYCTCSRSSCSLNSSGKSRTYGTMLHSASFLRRSDVDPFARMKSAYSR
jgi:hypothetical protein